MTTFRQLGNFLKHNHALATGVFHKIPNPAKSSMMLAGDLR